MPAPATWATLQHQILSDIRVILPGSTVVLTGANTYTGGTTVSAATLSVAVDGNLGDSSGGLTLNGGELLATGNLFNTSRAMVVTANNGTLAAATGGLGEFAGNITTSGGLTIGDGVNNGTVVLSGINTYASTTTIVLGLHCGLMPRTRSVQILHLL